MTFAVQGVVRIVQARCQAVGLGRANRARRRSPKSFKRSFQALRHFFTSALANAGVAPEVRMKLTGHKSTTVHRGYTHHELETLRAVVGKLGGCDRADLSRLLVSTLRLCSSKMALGRFYRRLKGRCGGSVAHLALARKLAELFWRLMVHGLAHVEQGLKNYEAMVAQTEQRLLQKLARSTTWFSKPKRLETSQPEPWFVERGSVDLNAIDALQLVASVEVQHLDDTAGARDVVGERCPRAVRKRVV